MQRFFRAASLAASVLLVSALGACGGGGGGGSPAPVNIQQPAAANLPPTGSFNSSVINLVGSFDASNSRDADGSISSYQWNFGDGSPVQTTSGPTTSHVFAASGTYTVNLVVLDAQGAASSVFSRNISVGLVSPISTTTSTPTTTTPTTTTTTPPPSASFTATPNALVVIFDAAASSAFGSSITSYSWNFGEPASGAANTSSSATSSTATHTYAAAGSYTVTLTLTDSRGARSVKQTSISVSPPVTLAASKLNDTGITASQCYQAGSGTLTSCTSTAAITLNSAQDGMTGRDASTASKSNADGKLGFSFTKIGPSGETLPASATGWACVKDNVTGLMWEVKTSDGGLRDSSKTYTNYDSTSQAQLSSGGNPSQAQINAATNSVGFKNAVNAVGLCGATDWRLPKSEELGSIVDYSVAYPGPTIDASWFPNTQGYAYWTSAPLVGGPRGAWDVSFDYGYVYDGNRNNSVHVRLVR